MRRALVLLVAALTGAACVSQSAKDPQNFKEAPLLGMIYDADNQPCSGVRVSVDDEFEVTTDIRGRFVLPELARGEHTLMATGEGYEELRVDFAFVSRTDALYLRMVTAVQLVAMAEGAVDQRKWTEAHGFLDRAEAVDGSDPVIAYLRALLAFREGLHERCAEILQRLLDAGVREPHVYLLLADVYEEHLGMPREAIANLESYLELRTDPDVRKRLEALTARVGTEE